MQSLLDFLHSCGVTNPARPASIELLNDVVKALAMNLPFSNVRALATPVPERRFDWSNETMFKKSGGQCFDLNMFAYSTLRALGFKTKLVAGGVTEDTIVHVGCIVEGLGPHDYLVDIGSGLPTLRAVPLDFPTESPVYTDRLLTYKFVRKTGADGRTRIWRYQKSLAPEVFSYPQKEGEWHVAAWFGADEVDRAQIESTILKNLLHNPNSPEMKAVRVIGYSSDKFYGVKNAVTLRELIADQCLVEFSCDCELMAAQVHKLFPGIPEDMLRAAYRSVCGDSYPRPPMDA